RQLQYLVRQRQQLAVMVFEQATELVFDPVGGMMAERLADHQVPTHRRVIDVLAAPISHRYGLLVVMMTVAVSIAVLVTIAGAVSVGVTQRRMLEHGLQP